MIPPPAVRSGNIAARESRCVRGGSADLHASQETRRASRARAGQQQVGG